MVKSIEKNQAATMLGTRTTHHWGLSMISLNDQQFKEKGSPNDTTYTSDRTSKSLPFPYDCDDYLGQGVQIYIIDENMLSMDDLVSHEP